MSQERLPIARILLACILPPLGVFLAVSFDAKFWINLLLTCLGYIPGLVHAIWVIARTPDDARGLRSYG